MHWNLFAALTAAALLAACDAPAPCEVSTNAMNQPRPQFSPQKGAEQLRASAAKAPVTEAAPRTCSSFDPPGLGEELGQMFKLQEADLFAALTLYQAVSGRMVVRAPNLPAARITLATEPALNRKQVLQALDTALAQQGIVMVLLGERFVKAVPLADAAHEAPPVIDLPWRQLPESQSLLQYVVPLKGKSVTELVPLLGQLAGLPNSVIGYKEGNVLILRDYSVNVRRMMEVLEKAGAIEAR